MKENFIFLVICIILGTALFFVEEFWLSCVLPILKERGDKMQNKNRETPENHQKENENTANRIELDASIDHLLNRVLDMDDCTEDVLCTAMELIAQRNNKADEDISKRLLCKLIEIRFRETAEDKRNSMKLVETKSLPTKTK